MILKIRFNKSILKIMISDKKMRKIWARWMLILNQKKKIKYNLERFYQPLFKENIQAIKIKMIFVKISLKKLIFQLTQLKQMKVQDSN